MLWCGNTIRRRPRKGRHSLRLRDVTCLIAILASNPLSRNCSHKLRRRLARARKGSSVATTSRHAQRRSYKPRKPRHRQRPRSAPLRKSSADRRCSHHSSHTRRLPSANNVSSKHPGPPRTTRRKTEARHRSHGAGKTRTAIVVTNAARIAINTLLGNDRLGAIDWR